VGDARYQLIDMDAEVDAYLSYGQADPHRASYFVVKTPLNTDSLIPTVRAQVRQLDALVPIHSTGPMTGIVADATANPRFSSLLLGVFAAMALIVAAVGVYGMLAYSVTQRTREIGIRLALGAERSKVAGLVIRDGLILCLIGLTLGLAGAFGATRLLRGLLYQVAPTDPGTYAAVAILLMVVSLLACWLPARRATRVDPLIALRSE
jgi:ABC-type antimicrobial peptide transport system permease subunit